MIRHRIFVAAFWTAAVFATVMAILPLPPAIPGNPTDKVQHIAAFAVLTILARLAYPKVHSLVVALTLSAFGGAIEIVQAIPALHRDSDWLDWLSDTAAALVALALVWLIGRAVKARG